MTGNEFRLYIEVIFVVVVLIAVFIYGLFVFVTGRPWRNIFQSNIDLSERVAQLEKSQVQDHESMMRIQLRLAELEIGIRILVAQIRRLGEEPEWTPTAAATVARQAVMDDRVLQAAVSSLFNLEELDDLAFQLEIKSEDLDGDTVGARARALVGYARRHGKLEALITLARQLRPEGEF